MLHKDNSCQSLKGASCSLTVTPGLWTFPVCLLGSLLSLDLCLVTSFSIIGVCQSFVWLVLTFILRVFASFHRFHISALGHLVALCIKPSVGVFGSLIVQSTSWLLFCTCSVVVKAFYCIIRAIYLFSAWILLGFILGLDHTAIEVFVIFLGLKDRFGVQGLDCVFIEWNLSFLLFVIISQNLFSALCHWNENEQSLLICIS